MCQSTNDLIPTAKEIVVHDELGKVVEATKYFAQVLRQKQEKSSRMSSRWDVLASKMPFL